MAPRDIGGRSLGGRSLSGRGLDGQGGFRTPLGTAGTSLPANAVTYNGQAVTSADNGAAQITYTQGS
jgi:hypothetical protein